MFETSGNLIAPIVAHSVVNGVNLPLLVRQYGPQGSSERREDAESREEEPP